MQALEQIPINTSMGFPVMLGQVAEIFGEARPGLHPPERPGKSADGISQAQRRDVGSVSKDIEAALAKYQMPDKYYYKIGGEQQDMRKPSATLAGDDTCRYLGL